MAKQKTNKETKIVGKVDVTFNDKEDVDWEELKKKIKEDEANN